MNIMNLPREKILPPTACAHCTAVFATDKDYTADATGAHYTCASCGKVTKTYTYDLRRVLVAREGMCFVCADWDQMEICAGAAVSGDKTLVGILEGKQTDPNNPIYDVHRVTAATIYNCAPENVTVKQRQDTKPVNFGALYGIRAKGLQQTLLEGGILLTLAETSKRLDAFFATYPGLKVWFDKSASKLNVDSYIVHPYGRIRHIVANSETNEVLSATNFIIQGWCASIMKECLTAIATRIASKSGNISLCIHDEIIVETKFEDAPFVAETLQQLMNISITDQATVQLVATPEIKFTLSKGAETFTVDQFIADFL